MYPLSFSHTGKKWEELPKNNGVKLANEIMDLGSNFGALDQVTESVHRTQPWWPELVQLALVRCCNQQIGPELEPPTFLQLKSKSINLE